MGTSEIDRRQFVQGASFLALAGGLSGTAAMPAAAQLSGDAEQALYEAAKKEGEFTWYVAHYSAEQAEAYGRAFMAKYPGIKANVVRTTAHVAYQRLTQELKSGGPQVDAFASTDVSHFIELKSKGLLEKFVPANGKSILPTLQNTDPDGFFSTTSIGTIGIAINTDKVKLEDAPKNWPDLLDPKWKNQIAVAHPAFSGYAGIWVWQMTQLYKWDFFEKLKDGNPQIGRSMLDPLTMLRAGERGIAATALGPSTEAGAKGEKIEIIYPTDGTILIIAPSAVVKGCKRPNAAKLFLEFMTSTDASKVTISFFGESIHAAVPSRSKKQLTEIKTLIADPQALLKGVPELKEKWRDTFGV